MQILCIPIREELELRQGQWVQSCLLHRLPPAQKSQAGTHQHTAPVPVGVTTVQSTEPTGSLLPAAEIVAETIKLAEIVAERSVKGCEGTRETA